MKNNDARERQHALDDLLKGGSRKTLKELLRRVSERRDKEYPESTFKSDIKFMRESYYNAPIICERRGKEYFYYYADKNILLETHH
jgi:hypothetical protein